MSSELVHAIFYSMPRITWQVIFISDKAYLLCSTILLLVLNSIEL